MAERLAERLAADGARVLERHGVALLRHDAARLHEAVRQPQVAELHRAPEQHVLHDAAETREQHRRGRHAFEQIVHRRDASVGVAGGAVEPEQVAREMAIDLESGAGNRARSQRVPVRARIRGLQARGVALQLLDDAEQVVRDSRGLRRLGVRMRGEERVAVLRWRDRCRPALSSSDAARSATMNSRCRIRYIVMSMSLRLRAVCSRPATSSPQALTSRRST